MTQLNVQTKNRLDASFTQALGVFATTKALNGVISMAQGTQVGPPGINISIGEILDPINDLVERFSQVMLAALVSLGVQKILYNFVMSSGFEVLLIASLILCNSILWFEFLKEDRVKAWIYKMALVLIFLRVCIPAMGVANEYIYANFIQQDYNLEVSKNIVENAKNQISGLDDTKASFFSSKYYEQKMQEFADLSTHTGDRIVDLMIIFVFQTMLFPLLFVFFLYQILRYIFTVSITF